MRFMIMNNEKRKMAKSKKGPSIIRFLEPKLLAWKITTDRQEMTTTAPPLPQIYVPTKHQGA